MAASVNTEELQLDTLPDSVLDLVLRMLHMGQQTAWPERGSAPYSIAALEATCSSLRAAVRRVHSEACCKILNTFQSGRTAAALLSSHHACKAVCITFPRTLGLATAAFFSHVDVAATLRVQQLSIWSVEDHVDAAVVLIAAHTFPHLHTIRSHSVVESCGDLCSGIAKCCPLLRSFEVRVPSFAQEHLGGLPDLRGLTSLALLEKESAVSQKYSPAFLRQVASLTDLTHLSLTVAYHPNSVARCLPLIARLAALRHLELLGSAYLTSAHIRALAAALPSLERLHIHNFDEDDGLGDLQPVDWCLPKLERLEVEDVFGSPDEDLGFSISWEAAAALAAGCPALRSWTNVNLEIRLNPELQSAEDEVRDPCGVQRCSAALAALASRGLMHSQVWLMVCTRGTAAEKALVAAVQRLQPEQCAALAGCVTWLLANGCVGEALVACLVERLPRLRVVRCSYGSLPALAQLQHIRNVRAWRGTSDDSSHVQPHEALSRFLELRALARSAAPPGGGDSPAAPVVVTLSQSLLSLDVASAMAEQAEAAGVRLALVLP